MVAVATTVVVAKVVEMRVLAIDLHKLEAKESHSSKATIVHRKVAIKAHEKAKHHVVTENHNLSVHREIVLHKEIDQNRSAHKEIVNKATTKDLLVRQDLKEHRKTTRLRNKEEVISLASQEKTTETIITDLVAIDHLVVRNKENQMRAVRTNRLRRIHQLLNHETRNFCHSDVVCFVDVDFM
jgi:hypothetical protein